MILKFVTEFKGFQEIFMGFKGFLGNSRDV